MSTGGLTRSSSVHRHNLSRDTILEVVSNQRRRFALYYLKQQRNHNVDHDGVPLGELADQVASWEYDKPVDELSAKERKRVTNALRQFHVPKMNDSGIVDYDPERNVISLTDAAASCDFYVDVLPKQGIPWGFYYVGLAGVSAICLIGIVAGIYPFSYFSPLTWSIFFVTAFCVSAIGHFYDNQYRMRLGARETPPEVDDR